MIFEKIRWFDEAIEGQEDEGYYYLMLDNHFDDIHNGFVDVRRVLTVQLVAFLIYLKELDVFLEQLDKQNDLIHANLHN